MSAFVLDASTVLAWLLRDAQAADADALIRQALDQGAAAPRLMALEVPNGLRNRIRRGLLSVADRDTMMDDFDRLPIAWHDPVDPQALVRLSDQHELTIYDATYLSAAQQLRLPLATLDARLAAAARQAGLATAP